MFNFLFFPEFYHEKNSFERMYVNYSREMYYSALCILNNGHDAEDAVHTAFIRVTELLDKINDDDNEKVKAFLIVIAKNIAIDIYRKEHRIKKVSYDELEFCIHNNNDKLFENDIILCIMKLPANYSTVLSLKYLYGYNNAEIGKMLDISEENVRQRIFRGKKKLKQLLIEEGIIDE